MRGGGDRMNECLCVSEKQVGDFYNLTYSSNDFFFFPPLYPPSVPLTNWSGHVFALMPDSPRALR